jgi:hypothetical protein
MAETYRRTSARKPRASKPLQLTPFGHGGARPGAGRKPNGPKALVSHHERPKLEPRFPVLVTQELLAGLPNLRHRDELAVLHAAFGAARERHGMRLVHFSIQSRHIHMVVEARHARALSRGMQGLTVRIARSLNRLWGRKGAVFADRYDSRSLR